MIHIDTSIVLTQILAEDRVPPPSLWNSDLVSSRLLHYESWCRLNSLGFTKSHGDDLRQILNEIMIVEMTPVILARSQEPFPIPIRTLGALHIATIEYLRKRDAETSLATFDARQLEIAKKMRIPIVNVDK